jgi:hypothetical protein
MVRNRCWPTTFHTQTTPQVLTNDAGSGWCDQPLIKETHDAPTYRVLASIEELCERGVNKRVHTYTRKGRGLDSLAGGREYFIITPTPVEVPCAPEEEPRMIDERCMGARRRANMYPPWTFSWSFWTSYSSLLSSFLPSLQSAQKV